MKKFWKKTEGFTLVELIVVIAILGILAGVGTVGYSGYVKKANMAADQQLLRDLNTAFAIACIENGVDNTQVTAENINVPSNGEVDDTILEVTISDTAKAAAIEDAFSNYFEGGTFKVMDNLTYSNGVFIYESNGAGGTFTELMNTIREALGEDAIEQASNSNLGNIGTENLFNQMNGAMDTAGELDLLGKTGMPFAEAYFEFLGIDLPDESASDEEWAAAQDALDAKLDALGVDDTTARTHTIALYAAKNAAGVTIDRLGQWLGGDTEIDDLKAHANADTLADTAAIYSLYLSYNQKNNTELSGNTLEVMVDALTDSNFATWVSTDPVAQEELTAYKTYMNIINEAAKDEDARNEILSNGFNNTEMQSLVKELMGK